MTHKSSEISDCFFNLANFTKLYKSPHMRILVESLQKSISENSVFFIHGERGTEKDYIVKTILQLYPNTEILRISGGLKRKPVCSRQNRTVCIIEQFENSDILSLFRYENKFKCSIFLSELDFIYLYRDGKISSEIYDLLSKSCVLYIPPLRERKQDILPLANFFLQEISIFLNLPLKILSREAKSLIMEYPWEGNAYQLKQCLTKAYILSRHQKIVPKDIFGEYDDKLSIKNFLEQKIGSLLKDFENIKNSNLYETVIQEVEKALFILALNETGGNQLRASKILGINRNTLNKKLKHYSLI